MIDSFRGKYYFLSNFYEVPVKYLGITYKNTEAAFQAQKCPKRSLEFRDLDASAAKSLGRRVTLRSDWERVKDDEMYKIILAKFQQNPDLAKLLKATGTKELIEGNTWGDRYWGKVNGNGLNKLGQILMKVRTKV